MSEKKESCIHEAVQLVDSKETEPQASAGKSESDDKTSKPDIEKEPPIKKEKMKIKKLVKKH